MEEKTLIDFIDRLSAVEESAHSAHKRIDGIEDLTKSVYEIATSIKAMQREMTDMSNRMKVIEDKPAKRWELIVSTVITTLVGIAIGYFINH